MEVKKGPPQLPLLTEAMVNNSVNNWRQLDNPVIGILLSSDPISNKPIIDSFVEAYDRKKFKDDERRQAIITHFGPIADSISSQDFRLEDTDLISIWTGVCELLTDYTYPRQAMADIIISSYLVQNQTDPSIRNFSRLYLENGELPEDVSNNPELLEVMSARARVIEQHIDEVNDYIFGIENSRQYLEDLKERMKSDDEDVKEDSKKEHSKIRIDSKERRSQTFVYLTEEFAERLKKISDKLATAKEAS